MWSECGAKAWTWGLERRGEARVGVSEADGTSSAVCRGK